MSRNTGLVVLLFFAGLVPWSGLAATDWQPSNSPRASKIKGLFDAKNYAKALEEIRSGGAGSSEEERLWMVLMEGATYAEQGSSTKALESFKRGLSSAPEATLPVNTDKAADLFVRARRELWEELLGKIKDAYKGFRYEDALKSLRKAERLPAEDREKVWIWLMMGVVQTELNKQGEALEAFVAALDLDPEATIPVESSPKVLALFKKAPAEVPAYRERMKKELTNQTLSAYGEKRYTDALAAAVRLRRRHGLPSQDAAWAELMQGVAYGELGQMAEAEQAFNRGLALAIEMGLPVPTSPEVTKAFERARTEQRKQKALRDAEQLYSSKQYDEALSSITKAEQSPVLTTAEKLSCHMLKGRIFADTNRGGEAVAEFRDVLTLDPRAQLPASPSPEQKKLFERAHYELRHPFQTFAYIAGGGGAAALGGGALFLAQAHGVDQRLRSSDPTITTVQQRQDAVQSGKLFQGTGWTMMGLGVAALGAGAALYLFETAGGGDGHVSAIVTPQGAMTSVTWSFP